jgi:hypothetical protein
LCPSSSVTAVQQPWCRLISYWTCSSGKEEEKQHVRTRMVRGCKDEARVGPLKNHVSETRNPELHRSWQVLSAHPYNHWSHHQWRIWTYSGFCSDLNFKLAKADHSNENDHSTIWLHQTRTLSCFPLSFHSTIQRERALSRFTSKHRY